MLPFLLHFSVLLLLLDNKMMLQPLQICIYLSPFPSESRSRFGPSLSSDQLPPRCRDVPRIPNGRMSCQPLPDLGGGGGGGGVPHSSRSRLHRHYHHYNLRAFLPRSGDVAGGEGGGVRCTPVCDQDHQFYQKFTSRAPTYVCNEHRVDWEIRSVFLFKATLLIHLTK